MPVELNLPCPLSDSGSHLSVCPISPGVLSKAQTHHCGVQQVGVQQVLVSFPVPGDSATAGPSGHHESLDCKTALSDLSFLNL